MLGVLEDRDVEVRGLLGLAVEPKARGESVGGHGYLLERERCHFCRRILVRKLIGGPETPVRVGDARG